MADDPAVIAGKPKRKGGRPTRAEASAKALLGIDLAAVDPVQILRSIAAYQSTSAAARVAACRALLGLRDQASAGTQGGDVGINARAIARMMQRAN